MPKKKASSKSKGKSSKKKTKSKEKSSNTKDSKPKRAKIIREKKEVLPNFLFPFSLPQLLHKYILLK